MNSKIVVIEKTPELREKRVQQLTEKGFEVYPASGYRQAMAQMAVEPDVVLLCDCAHECMPWACCRVLKEVSHARFIAITEDDERRMVDAFRAGVDECASDPIQAMMLAALRPKRTAPRRTDGNGSGNGHSNGDENGSLQRHPTLPLCLDKETFKIRVNESTLDASATEFRVLSVLVKYSPSVVSHVDLLREVWGPEYTEDGSILRLYIHTLRRKISEAGGEREWIRNVPRVGYSLQPRAEDEAVAVAG